MLLNAVANQCDAIPLLCVISPICALLCPSFSLRVKTSPRLCLSELSFAMLRLCLSKRCCACLALATQYFARPLRGCAMPSQIIASPLLYQSMPFNAIPLRCFALQCRCFAVQINTFAFRSRSQFRFAVAMLFIAKPLPLSTKQIRCVANLNSAIAVFIVVFIIAAVFMFPFVLVYNAGYEQYHGI